MYRALNGLNLNAEQQAECHYFVGMQVSTREQAIASFSDVVKDELEERHMMRLHRTRRDVVKLNDEDHRLIDRRFKIWRCGLLTKWSPSATGKLYDSSPGYLGVQEQKPMTRQRAAKFSRAQA